MGWKINVLDECDVQAAGSEIKETKLRPDSKVKREQQTEYGDDLESSQSIQVESVLKPNGLELIEDKDTKKMQTLQPPPPETLKQPEVTSERNNDDRLLQAQSLPKLISNQKFRVTQIKKRPSYTTRSPQRRKEPRPSFKSNYNRPNIKKPVFNPNNVKVSNSQIRLKTKPLYAPRRPQILMGKQKLNIPKPEHVEISPQQASTEREPEVYSKKKPYAPLISVIQPSPQKEHYKDDMPLAVNTGFHPESVVIEGGFRPIINKESTRRSDDEGPELKYESEIGVIDVNVKNTSNTIILPKKSLKAEKRRATASKNPVYIVFKRGRSESDEVADAAERVESYYLPPPNQRPKAIDEAKQPSNIDIPPGTVVTYDGKKVSGASLTIKPHDTSTVLEARSSKAYEYIKAHPQYGPFKGELPPLDTKFLLETAPQLQSRGTVINRELDTPDLPHSTKLTRVDSKHIRNKRAPHHTPEHTAEQANNNNNNNQTTTGSSEVGAKLITPLLVLNIVVIWFV